MKNKYVKLLKKLTLFSSSFLIIYGGGVIPLIINKKKISQKTSDDSSTHTGGHTENRYFDEVFSITSDKQLLKIFIAQRSKTPEISNELGGLILFLYLCNTWVLRETFKNAINDQNDGNSIRSLFMGNNPHLYSTPFNSMNFFNKLLMSVKDRTKFFKIHIMVDYKFLAHNLYYANYKSYDLL